MRREARAQLRCEPRRKRYAARHGAARRQRWVRGGPGTGRDSLPRILGGCGARSPAVTAAGRAEGGGVGVRLWGLGPRWGAGAGRGTEVWGPGRPPVTAHRPRGPRLRGTLTRGQDRRPLPAAGVSQKELSLCHPFLGLLSVCGVGNPPLDSKLQQNL